MARFLRKSKHDHVSHRPCEFLLEEDRKFFADKRWFTVKAKTRRQYDARVQLLKETYGGITFGHLAQYLRLHDAHVVATKRATISAVSDYRWCTFDPLTTEEVTTLMFTLDTMETEEAERMERAALTPKQFKQFVQFMITNKAPYDVIEGAEVMHDLACRSFNIRDLTRQRWHTLHRTVECEKKGTDLMKRRKGKFDVKPYQQERTHQILTDRAKQLSERKLEINAAMFPDWDADLVSRLMRQCAEHHKWPADFVYCCYCLRHSAAAEEYEKAHEMAKAAVRKLLAHRAAGNEMRYGASNTLRRGRRGRRMRDDDVEETDDAEEGDDDDGE